MSGSVLVLTNASHEPPGLLEPWLEAAGVAVRVLPAWDVAEVPSSWREAGADALVVMGGPQSAYDDPETGKPDAPWLPATKTLLREATNGGAAVLAICLGSQLLAEACGGLVRPGAAGGELGARLVARRDAAIHDPLFGPLPMTPDVVQWHWDEISVLPPGSTLLASSTAYPHQAFRVGDRAYGLQFHIETTPELVDAWAGWDADHLTADQGPEAAAAARDRLVAGVRAVQDDMERTWRPMVERFAAMVGS